eukprot:17300-Heterococcus_DN1.PRE.3
MNRSQEDIDNGTGLAEARAAETEYFANHKVWGGAAAGALRKQIGMQHLSDKLTHVLVDRIKTGVPDIIEEVDDELTEARSELALLGDALDGRREASVMMRLVYTVCNDLLNAARGKYEGISMEDSDARLCTLVNAEFDDFKAAVLKTRPSCDDDSIKAMQEELTECTGEEPQGFCRNYSYFKGKFASTVSEWGAQSELMLREVQTAVSEVVELLLGQEQLKRFPQLEVLLLDTAQEVGARLICCVPVAVSHYCALLSLSDSMLGRVQYLNVVITIRFVYVHSHDVILFRLDAQALEACTTEVSATLTKMSKEEMLVPFTLNDNFMAVRDKHMSNTTQLSRCTSFVSRLRQRTIHHILVILAVYISSAYMIRHLLHAC